MRFPHLQPAEDGPWVVPAWSRVRPRNENLSVRLRNLPRVSPLTFRFASWWLFLVLGFIGCLLLIETRANPPFAETAGLPLDLKESRISPEELQQLRDGQPVRSPEDWIRIHPRFSLIVSTADLRDRTDIEAQVASRCEASHGEAAVVVDLEPEARYEKIVDSLSRIAEIDFRLSSCTVRPYVLHRPAPPVQGWVRVRG